MKKLIAIPGSSSSQSINKQLVSWASTQVDGAEAEVLDLNDFEMPIYSMDTEATNGIPEKAKEFIAKIEASDGILISLAEHNGSYSTALKNILDWASRAKQKVWSDKKMFLMSSSPGGRGGQTVRASAEHYFPYMGADIVALFSLPKFGDNFKEGLVTKDLANEFTEALKKFQDSI